MTHRTFFKTGPPVKVARRLVHNARKRAEDLQMQAVRRRDRRCRFPLCGCAKFGLPLDVSHKFHRGIGGDPSGERTTRETMVLICRFRHRIGRVSIDRGTLRWEALTERGADGPIAWFVDGDVVGYPGLATLIELARERRRGELEPLQAMQRTLLLELATLST